MYIQYEKHLYQQIQKSSSTSKCHQSCDRSRRLQYKCHKRNIWSSRRSGEAERVWGSLHHDQVSVPPDMSLMQNLLIQDLILLVVNSTICFRFYEFIFMHFFLKAFKDLIQMKEIL